MNLGVQYYRPPFPVQKYWAEDMKRIRASGLDTLQLWMTWAWVESTPGRFNFDDYDRLIEMANDAGLNVLLSTIAELQPHWIHHEAPGSEMIDNYGNTVISSLREESNFGLTPGGCTEHPLVWQHMAKFLSTATLRYRNLPHLAGWDAWNELRWHEQSDALVCFCPHCIEEFRKWLNHRHGGLNGLNKAWQRRYSNWSEVMPGKLHWRTFTEMMAWQHFISWKANRHGKKRYDLIKSLDPHHDVTVHAGDPSPITSGNTCAYAIDRGNDWFYADQMDGVGCSSFPKLFSMSATEFSTRIEYVHSAARGKKLWLSELQGGRGAMGFQPTEPVTAREQQHWVWRGIAGGANKILFWCWRDEIFGRESSGFGMCGNDGHSEERLKAMAHTSNIVKKHHALLNNYQTDTAKVGVLFSPQTYYLHWSLNSHADEARNALEGCCQALITLNIPYTVIEECHLDAIDSLDVLLLPRLLVTSAAMETTFIHFVKRGGVLVCESECGAFTSEGIYRYPEERFLTRSGLVRGHEAGRRSLPADNRIRVNLSAKETIELPTAQWLTPWQGIEDNPAAITLAAHADGALVANVPAAIATGHTADEACTANAEQRAVTTASSKAAGTTFASGTVIHTPPTATITMDALQGVTTQQGRVILCGTSASEAYYHTQNADYLRFIEYCCAQSSGTRSNLITATTPNCGAARSEPVHIRTGTSGGHRIAFIFLPDGCNSVSLNIPKEFFNSTQLAELLSEKHYTLSPSENNEYHLPLSINSTVNGIIALAGI